jgi:hypothetical protein
MSQLDLRLQLRKSSKILASQIGIVVHWSLSAGCKSTPRNHTAVTPPLFRESNFVRSVKSSKVTGMEPEVIKEMEHRTKVILNRLADTLPENTHGSGAGPWMFGLQEPSALDAHTIIFVERMRDVDRMGLVPEKLDAWSQKATEQEAWRNMMDGRRTMAPPRKP